MLGVAYSGHQRHPGGIGAHPEKNTTEDIAVSQNIYVNTMKKELIRRRGALVKPISRVAQNQPPSRFPSLCRLFSMSHSCHHIATVKKNELVDRLRIDIHRKTPVPSALAK